MISSVENNRYGRHESVNNNQGVNYKNLIKIPVYKLTAHIGLVNCQSVRNKVHDITHHVLDNDIDVCARVVNQ